jgi:hypothetical protein
MTRPDPVWSSDITYIRLRAGFIYLTSASAALAKRKRDSAQH